MHALITTRHADWVAQAAVALQRIAEHMTPDMEVLRGTFFGNQGVDLELQLATVAQATQLASNLGGAIPTHEVYDLERGPITGEPLRRHIWIGELGGLPLLITAFEHVQPLPVIDEGARFPEPAEVAPPAPAPEA
jgi:hypothetical protein